MIRFEDECVGCPPEMGCLGSSCKYRHVPHLYCDNCEADVDKLYKFNGMELCIDCLLDGFETIDVDDIEYNDYDGGYDDYYVDYD